MKKTLLLLLLAIFSVNAQNSQWRETSVQRLSSFAKMDRESFPSEYKLFQLELSSMKNRLAAAPNRDASGISNVIIDFPLDNGTIEHFKVFKSDVMHPELSDKFPDINTYVGVGVEDRTATITITTSLFGLHGMILSAKHQVVYIDTYTKDLDNYIVYNKSTVSNNKDRICLVDSEISNIASDNKSSLATMSNDGIFRRYRLAMACTIEYAAFHVNAAGLSGGTLAEKKNAVLAAMVVTVNRVNAVYEKELSVTLQLVANNDLLIFVDSDNFSNDNASALIAESQSVITNTILSANFDIGHTVSTGGGGLAGLGVVCNTAQKARGITGSPSPVGDPYDIDYVAHEMGHQFGCNHTFTGTTGSCTGNRNDATAVEPGSGSSIMAYAGICTGQNVQGNSDAYFHTVSLAEAFSYITSGATCSTNITSGNQAPVIAAATNYTIPLGTPFQLTAPTTTDGNGDTISYCWEQTKNPLGSIANVPSATSTGGINFRSYSPTLSPSRYFPKMADILVGNLSPTWEILPTVSRTMNFALTARDNGSPNGGQTAVRNLVITVDGTRGPLLVTSQNTDGIVWTPGATETITWNVNNTNGSAGGTNVDILLSTDGGQTYPTILLANTPNDGSQPITVPNISAANCRVMIKASGNIFFNVNLKNIAIGNYTYQTQNICTDYTFNLNAPITESADNTYPGTVLNIADSYTITDANFYANVTHPVIGQFNLLIMAPFQTALNTAIWFNNTTCTSANMDKWFDTSGSAVSCATTAAGSFLPFSVTNINNYNGQNSAGSWRVYFKDAVVDSNVSSASFNTFKIQLCRAESVAVLSNATYELENFAIYPNPNNGNFTVKFDAATEKTKISIHDLSGRNIYNEVFQINGLFNKDINLKHTQAGIYLVTVESGSRKTSTKIIVE